MANNVSQDQPASVRLKKTKSKEKRGESRGKVVIQLSAFIIILATIAITLFLAVKGSQSFFANHLNVIKFLFGSEWGPTNTPPKYGALIFITGSLLVTLAAAIVAAPLGLGGAIFMTEIAKSWGQKILQPVIEILVGIPSVVYGYIGLVVIVPYIHKHVGGLGYGLLAAAVVIGVMILPTVTSLSADAIKTIPTSLRDASLALGATRWQTIYKVVIPAALPSLLTAIVLGMARAFGEALAVQMVVGNAQAFPHSLTDPTATLTTVITSSMGETTFGSLHNNLLWSLGLVLLVVSYIFIIIIRYLSSRRKV